jgi:galactokinase
VPSLDAHRERLSSLHFSRCRHVVEEILRVAEASEMLPGGDLSQFGQLMSDSHRSIRDDFDASHPVLDRLVDNAAEIPGVLGSRITGGGFGGCTVHLVSSEAIPKFEDRLRPLLDELPGSSVFRVDAPAKAGVVEVIA